MCCAANSRYASPGTEAQPEQASRTSAGNGAAAPLSRSIQTITTWPAQVVIELFVERLGNTSLTIGHRIVDGADGNVLYCDGHAIGRR